MTRGGPVLFPPALSTARLALRRHDPAVDAPKVFAAVRRERARLGEHLAWVNWAESPADLQAHLREVAAQWASGEFFDYALLAGADEFVGNVGVHAVNWTTGTCELGYWIVAEREGRGYVAEAAAAVVDLCFARGLHRIEIRCTPENLRSARAAERLGFRREATLRGATVDTTGRRRDLVVFARLAGDDPPAAAARPAGVVHWSDLLEGDESPYPDSVELFGVRSRLARAFGVSALALDHLALPPGRRGWRPGDPLVRGTLAFVVDGAPALRRGVHAWPLRAGDAVLIGPDDTLANAGPADARLLLVRAACAAPDAGA